MADCQNCGRMVSERFAKVYGDNSDTMQYCPECIIKSGYRKEMIYRGGCATQNLEKLYQKVTSTHIE